MLQEPGMCRGSKSGSDYKNDEGTDDNSSDDANCLRESGKVQTDVPADEMLSDDYYEHDGDDLSDSMTFIGVKSSGISKPISQYRPASIHNSRNSNALKHNGSDDDLDIDYDDEEEIDEDDPDDADFEPDDDDIQIGRTAKKNLQSRNSGADQSDDAGESDEDFELSDEDEAYNVRKPKVTQRGRNGISLKITKDKKSNYSTTRQMRGNSFEYEVLSEKENDDTDESFTRSRRALPLRRYNGGPLIPLANTRGPYSEIRTSSRSVRKVSYVESDGSDEDDGGKKIKIQKDEIEEDDGDSIERVLWHQPKGMAEEALKNNRPADPVLLGHLFDSEPDWNEIEFLIKWKGQSHLHCQWKLFSDLQNLPGFKKVINYTKKVSEDVRFRNSISREEIEVNDVSKEMDLELIKQYSQAERIIADRISKEGSGDVTIEYMVKWQGLSYVDANGKKQVKSAIAQEAIDECKGPLLDFFGVPVRANDLFIRVQELQHLEKRITRYEDPIRQFRVLTYLKPSTWSKGCGWSQIDDARLLLGIHYHGFGNWEKIRLDDRLGLTKKIAPVELQLGETFLPRAPNLRDRANALLELELAAIGVKQSKSSRKPSKKDKEILSSNSLTTKNGVKVKPGGGRVNPQMNNLRSRKQQKVETMAKEEGEMSDNEEVYEQFKEVKWMEWCSDVMTGEERTLKRLHKLQKTSADLPKEKVLAKIRNYLKLLGRRIDQIVFDHEEEPYKQERMTIRLWKYVSTYSNLSGDKLHQIYSKLKQELDEDAGAGPSHFNGCNRDTHPILSHQVGRGKNSQNASAFQTSDQLGRGYDNGNSEAWKRRRRAEDDTKTVVQATYQRPIGNGAWASDPNSLGILGAAPTDNRRFNDRPVRTRQTGPAPK